MQKPTKALKHWLECTDFLTQKLKKAAGDANLQLLKQKELPTSWWDKYHLKITDAKVIHRDILMTAKGLPCWLARTIIPISSFKAQESVFKRLEKETLGHIIFGKSDIKRVWLKYYDINSFYIEYYWIKEYLPLLGSVVKPGEQNLWLRLSNFVFEPSTFAKTSSSNSRGLPAGSKDPFYLVEILLPDLLKVIS
jgi:chorismate--pyruvate lyase